MKTLGAVGPGSVELLERIAPELDGRTALVESRPDVDERRPDPVETAFELGGDGTWSGSGAGRSLDDLLDALAPDHEYALLAGFPDARVPTVALGGADARRTALSAPDADVVDVDDAFALLEGAEPHVTLETLVERAKRSPRTDRAGAVATFTGRVRAKDDPDDSRTVRLEFEKYEGVADERMARIERELSERDGVQDVLLHHRTGLIGDGEDIVFVVVLAGHREEAFRTVEDGINRLKDEVPIFKKETTVDDEFWVHDRAE